MKNTVSAVAVQLPCARTVISRAAQLAIQSVVVGGLLLSAGLSEAQSAKSDNEQLERVIVTGSNIRRISTETSSPVQVITSDELKKSGLTSVADVLRTITANGAGTLSAAFSGAFASGANGVALRGLTVGSTLVLIDGRRMAPYPLGDDGQRSFVDTSSIPFDAIERIEVLKDGASAVYGSDAIAGVVNVILKRSYVGQSVTAEYAQTSKGDGRTHHWAGILGGGRLEQDGRNAYFAAEYRKQDPIFYSQRPGVLTRRDYTAQGGENLTRGVPNEANGGQPGSTTGYITDATGNVPGIAGFMKGCDAARLAAGQCAYENTWSQVQPTTSNLNLVGRYTQRLSDDWQLSLQATHFVSKSEQTAAPSASFSGGYQGLAFGPGQAPQLLPGIDATTISSSNPSFPSSASGLTSGVLNYNFMDLGPNLTTTQSRSTRLVADVQGTLDKWDVTAAAGYTEVRLDVNAFGAVNPYNLQTALNDTAHPYLVGGPNGDEVKAFIAPVLRAKDSSKLSFLQASASREVAQLPGGALSLSIGASAVHRQLRAVAPDDVASGRIGGNNAFAIGTQNVKSVYGELLAPVTKSLEFEGALRYDHYNLSGGKASPKLGFKFEPMPELALRGTLSKGFRAPGPAENGNAGQSYLAAQTTDAVLCPHGDNANTPGNFPTQCLISPTAVNTTNPQLKPETSSSYTLGLLLQPNKAFSARLDYYSIDLKNQIITPALDYATAVAVRNTTLTPIPFVNPDGSVTLKAPPVGTIAYFSNSYVNANETKTSGIDVDLEFRHRFEDLGEVRSNLMVSHMLKYDVVIDGHTYELAGTHGPSVVSGDTGNPKTRIQWVNTWSRGPVQLTGTVNYLSGYSVIDPSAGMPDCLTALQYSGGAAGSAFQTMLGAGKIPDAGMCKVSAFTTFDLNVRYEYSKQLSFTFSALNLFNRSFPLDWATYGGAGGQPFNPSLHAQGAIGRTFNVGATYKF